MKTRRAALDCLRVCYQNISVLELLKSTDASSTYTAGELSCSASQSYMQTQSSATDVNWNSWTEDREILPSLRKLQRFATLDEIAPETSLDEQRPSLRIFTRNKTSARSSQTDASVPPPPPNTARSTQCFSSSLSPSAKTFEPGSVCETPEECMWRLDKLRISEVLASKRYGVSETARWKMASPVPPCSGFSTVSADRRDTPRHHTSCVTPKRQPSDTSSMSGSGIGERRRSISV